MKSMIGGACATLMGLGLAVAPQAAQAGVVGEYNACGTENLSVPVAAAGHTWVSVGTLDTASLQSLDALVLRTCGPYSGNAAVDAAVADGMDLVLDATGIPDNSLPGLPALSFNAGGGCEFDYPLAAGAPIATGPGGTLTNDSLDATSWCSIMNTTLISTLPAGVIPFVTTSDATRAGALGYTHGRGQVAVSNSQWSHVVVYRPVESLYPGIKTYFINTLAWALGQGGPRMSCASEGYTGTKLEWCKNICERGYTGSTLAMWIRRWTDRYRTLPYCAVETQPTLR